MFQRPPSPVTPTTGLARRRERGAERARQAVADRREAAVGDVPAPGACASRRAAPSSARRTRRRPRARPGRHTGSARGSAAACRSAARRSLLAPRASSHPGARRSRHLVHVRAAAPCWPQRRERGHGGPARASPTSADVTGVERPTSSASTSIARAARRAGGATSAGSRSPRACTDGDEQSAALDEVVGDRRVAAEQADVERVGAGDRALAARSCGRPGSTSAAASSASAACAPERCTPPPARMSGRLAAPSEPRGATRRRRRRARRERGGGAGARRRELVVAELDDAVGDVLGDVEHDRARPPRRRDRESPAHELGDAARDLDAQELLTAGRRSRTWSVSWVMCRPACVALRVADDGDDRAAGVERLDQAGDEVRRAGPSVASHTPTRPDTRAYASAAKRRAALVVDQDVPQAERADGVVEGQELEAAHAEHRPEPWAAARGHGLAARAATRSSRCWRRIAVAGRIVHLTCGEVTWSVQSHGIGGS